MLALLTAACVFLGLSSNFPRLSSALWQTTLIVGGWILSAALLMLVLLTIQAPIFLLIRRRLKKKATLENRKDKA